MTTYKLINKTTSEIIDFIAFADNTFGPFARVEEIMYIQWELTPCETTSHWARKCWKKPVRFTYHGWEFVELEYDRENRIFTIWDVRAYALTPKGGIIR